jgi:hypothetical protein
VRPIVFGGLIGGTCTVWLRLWSPVGKDLQAWVVILGGGDLLEERFVGFGVHDNELVRAGRDECESIIEVGKLAEWETCRLLVVTS